MLLQAFYSIRSERLLMERLEYDLLFRWFVGICARLAGNWRKLHEY
jgi:transposase